MSGKIYDEIEVTEIRKRDQDYSFERVEKKVISEISLKVIVNGEELVSLLCLNKDMEELALGFLYSEGVIDSLEDIKDISYNEPMFAVVVELRDGLGIDRSESLRSITSGCGKCYTYINPLKQKMFRRVESESRFSVADILRTMENFMESSQVFINVGGVHSVMLRTSQDEILSEDIGRHNCFDKIVGFLLKSSRTDDVLESALFVSGRISSEIMTKVIRLGVPLLVSRSTPTTSAVRLAQKYNVTLMGYVRGERGYIYSCPERITR